MSFHLFHFNAIILSVTITCILNGIPGFFLQGISASWTREQLQEYPYALITNVFLKHFSSAMLPPILSFGSPLSF
jgi:hypothetical protein